MSDAFPTHAMQRLLELAAEAREPQERYRIIRTLGRGGMGVVYEAEDLHLRRPVALKVLEGTSTELRSRFVREALAAARLSHPGIAAVYDATPQVIAMQLIQGGPLSSVPPSDVRRLVRLVRDAALAVHHAHEHGLVHRDLKPGNLLVEGDRIVVVDFGLVKEITVEATLSAPGGVAGTPAFMAPEQALGRTAEINPRTDVYGLGATLYACLRGAPPFAATELMELLQQVVEQEPPRCGVDRDLDLILARAMSKENERRYPTARAFADDLERWLLGRPVLAQPASALYRFRKFVARRRVLLRAAASAALLAGVATAGVLLPALWEQRAAAKALELSWHGAGVLADYDVLRRAGRLSEANRRLDAAIEEAGAYVKLHDLPRGWHLYGRLLRVRGRLDEARIAFDRACSLNPELAGARFERGLSSIETDPALAVEDLAAEVGPEDNVSQVDLLFGRAERQRLLGQLESARAALEEVKRLDPLYVPAWISLSKVYLEYGHDEQAMEYAMRCATSAVDIQRGFARAYLARDQATLPAGVLENAPTELYLPHTEGVLVDIEALIAQRPVDGLALAHQGVDKLREAAALQARNETSAALQAAEQAVQHHHAALRAHPGIAAVHNNRGVAALLQERCWRQQGDTQRADGARDRARADFDLALYHDPDLAAARRNRTLSGLRETDRLLTAGAPEETCAEAERTIRLCDQAVALRPGDAAPLAERALIRELLARALQRLGRTAAAELALAQARHDLDQALDREPASSRLLLLRGMMRRRTGDLEGGRRDLEQALATAPADWPHAELCRRELQR